VAFIELCTGSLLRGPVLQDHITVEVFLLSAKLGKSWVTADETALLVGDVFRGL
jgi:hypothetical protein